VPKLVVIATTISLRRRTGAPVPVLNSRGSGSVMNRSRKAERISFWPRWSRALSTSISPTSGSSLTAPTKARSSAQSVAW